MNTEFAFTEEGDLLITLMAQGRQLIQERHSLVTQISQSTEAESFLELLDDQLVQGWYVVPMPHGQTGGRSVLLTRQIWYDELGRVSFVGPVYWCPRSEQEPYVDTLQLKGNLLFRKGYQGDPIQLKMVTG